MFKEIEELTLSQVIEGIKEQGYDYDITYHSSSKSGKSWQCVKLEDGTLFAKQNASKNDNGLYFLCNNFANSKGIING